jgi:SAM-dependent methyltransferase
MRLSIDTTLIRGTIRSLMTGDDAEYVKKIIGRGLASSPCLELGTGYGGSTSKDLISSDPSLKYYGTDMQAGAGVDFVADFEAPSAEVARAFQSVGEFGTILILNVLEHCFDPIRVLDNAVGLLRKGGRLVLLTPSIWPLHDYPRDCWRINPNFYEEYARRRGLTLLPDTFEFVGFGLVKSFAETPSADQYPKPSRDKLKALYSRIAHRLLNTYGRGMLFPSHVAVGVVLEK